jgi:adenine phosphoribosyltransferase
MADHPLPPGSQYPSGKRREALSGTLFHPAIKLWAGSALDRRCDPNRITTTEQNMDLKNWIREIPDYPKPGILFRDLTPLWKSPEAFNYTIDCFAEKYLGAPIDAVAGIESRGFIFGVPLALKLGLPFIPIRKENKLPPEVVGVDFELEYGTGRVEMRVDAVVQGDSVLVVDDLLATGGTAEAAAKLIQRVGGQVLAMAFVVELGTLNGRDVLKGHEIYSLVTY